MCLEVQRLDSLLSGTTASCWKACHSGCPAWPLHISPIYWDCCAAQTSYRKVLSYGLNEAIMASESPGWPLQVWEEDLGVGDLVVGRGGGIISPFVSQGWEGHLPSPFC